MPIITKQAENKLIAETMLALTTTDNKSEAARMLKINRSTLYDRIKKYDLENYIANYIEDAAEVLAKGSVRAARNLVDKIDHRRVDISLKASTETLDRVGITKQEPPQIAVAGREVKVIFPDNIKNKYAEPDETTREYLE